VLAVAIGDVDHFKNINDSLGHDAGDQVRRHVARVMRGALRETDLVARWGGEVFLLLLEVVDHAERLSDAVIGADRNLIRAKELGRNRVVAS